MSLKEGTDHEICVWVFNGDHGAYETECENDFIFEDGNVETNSFCFCPFCGLEIEEE